MDVTSYIATDREKVLGFSLALRDAIRDERKKRCDDYIAKLNEWRQRRVWWRLWIKLRPFVDEADYVRTLGRVDWTYPDSYRWLDEQRLVELARAAKHANRVMYLSVEDFNLVMGR